MRPPITRVMAAATMSPRELRAWLRAEPSLAELREAFPREWDAVKAELQTAAGKGEQAMAAYVAALAARAAQAGGSRGSAGVSLEVRRRMAAGAFREMAVSAATGVTHGKVRFRLLDGFIAQRLLFRQGLVRKPARAWLFRLVWPLVLQKRLLMPLVQPKGIYCFYSGALVRALARLADGRRVLEIAAGDGTLTGFLRDAGCDALATDDGSWQSTVATGVEVLRQDAATALRAHAAEVVVCSWPPAGNAFEREVFRTPGVQAYVVVNGAKEYGSGDHAAYAQALASGEWEGGPDARLSRLVLPPELGCVVHVYRRRAAA